MARLTTVKPGDIVEVNRGGRRFYALVRNKAPGRLDIVPLDKRYTYYTAKAVEIIGVWRADQSTRVRVTSGHDAD
jgi:hypothetical protein